MKTIETLLSELYGVIDVSQVPNNNRSRIVELESSYEKGGVIGLKNLGIRIVLKSSIVFAILKDTSFRLPTGPTVFMVEDISENEQTSNHILKIRDKSYHIVGEEIIGKKLPVGEDYIFVSNDFILYPGRRKGRTKKPAYFLIPPIGFPELELVKDTHKITNIISVSPSTMTDDYIRELCAFSTRNDLATILVGFDTDNKSH